jgi:hypothetical protein
MTQLFLGLPESIVRLDVDGGSARAEVCVDEGPVTAMAVDPGRQECVYAATRGNGLWYTHDGGDSWHRGGARIDRQALSAAVVSLPDRADDLGVLYIGTEPSALYKSTDGGRTFDEIVSLQEIPSRPEWSYPPRPDTHHVWSLATDPADAGVLYVGIELGGIMRTTDGGREWAEHPAGADADPHTLRTHRSVPGRVYEGGGSFFCETRDGGATWVRDVEGIPEEIRYFYSLAVDPGDPDTVLISAARDPLEGHGQPPAARAWSTIYRRSASREWHEVTEGLPPREGTRMGWLVTDQETAGLIYYVTIPGGVYRTQDGGLTFEQLPWEWPDGAGERKVRAAVAAHVQPRGRTPAGETVTTTKRSTMNETEAADAAHRLRVAVHAFGGPPQAQRRWVQMGMLQRARDILDADLASVPDLLDAGAIDAEQARLLEKVGAEYCRSRDANDDLLEEAAAQPREYLWSAALEGDDWHALRHLARDCFRAMSIGREPLIDV